MLLSMPGGIQCIHILSSTFEPLSQAGSVKEECRQAVCVCRSVGRWSMPGLSPARTHTQLE